MLNGEFIFDEGQANAFEALNESYAACNFLNDAEKVMSFYMAAHILTRILEQCLTKNTRTILNAAVESKFDHMVIEMEDDTLLPELSEAYLEVAQEFYHNRAVERLVLLGEPEGAQ